VQGTARYPHAARAQELEGTVLVRARLSSDGAVEDIEILASAGPILDDAAISAVKRAAPFGTGPGWVQIPVEFRLDTP
jgi:TonB family protein